MHLNDWVCDANGVEDLGKVVRDKAIPRPLREESNGEDNTHALQVSTFCEQRQPANVSSNLTIKVDGCFDLVVLVNDQRVFPETKQCKTAN